MPQEGKYKSISDDDNHTVSSTPVLTQTENQHKGGHRAAWRQVPILPGLCSNHVSFSEPRFSSTWQDQTSQCGSSLVPTVPFCPFPYAEHRSVPRGNRGPLGDGFSRPASPPPPSLSWIPHRAFISSRTQRCWFPLTCRVHPHPPT